jgi:hypothetical protein
MHVGARARQPLSCLGQESKDTPAAVMGEDAAVIQNKSRARVQPADRAPSLPLKGLPLENIAQITAAL